MRRFFPEMRSEDEVPQRLIAGDGMEYQIERKSDDREGHLPVMGMIAQGAQAGIVPMACHIDDEIDHSQPAEPLRKRDGIKQWGCTAPPDDGYGPQHRRGQEGEGGKPDKTLKA